MRSSRDAAQDLARRRGVLLARSARLREEIADDVQEVRRGTGLLDRGLGLLDRGRAVGPMLVPLALAGGVVLALGRPSRILRLATRALALWPVVRPFVPRVVAFIAARRAAGAHSRMR
jgi:hypothetical protein